MGKARQQVRSLLLPFVAVLAAQTLIAIISLQALSTVRAYIAGESHWSKAQKDAVHHLRFFIRTSDEAAYRAYEKAIGIPLSDKAARLALEASPVDVDVARHGFLGGGNHPDDISGMIWAFRYLRGVIYIAAAVESWRRTDRYLDELVVLGQTAHARVGIDDPSLQTALDLDQRVLALDSQLSPHAHAFSASLGQASRAFTVALALFNTATALVLVSLVVFATRRLLARGVRYEAALQKERHAALERGQLLQGIIDNFPGGITFTDAEMRLALINRQGKDLLGFPDSLFANGAPALEAIFRFNAERGEYGKGDVDEQVTSRMKLARQRIHHVFERTRPDGTVIEVRGAPLASGGFVTTYTDVTERREAEAEIVHLAYHDRLTNLANRSLLSDRIDHEIATAAPGKMFALHMIDLDHFKSINDTHGHLTGDALLREAARRLQDVVALSGTVARMGGDEFAVLQPDLQQCTDAAALASRIVASLGEPYDLEGRRVYVSASVGIAAHASEGATANDIMRNADLALYASKGAGRARFSFFEPDLGARARERLELRDELRLALDNGELCVHYQPIVDLATSQVVAREALIRWQHPDKGAIAPSLFIPIAEEFGLIDAITRFVLKSACHDAMHWPDQARVAVNLSAVNFRCATLASDILDVLADMRFPAQRLELEVTESALLDASEERIDALHALRRAGVKIALDDFGTGYSSLSYLAQFPLDKLKIDRSFVWGMESNTRSMAIVSAVAHLGRTLGLVLTAEGIETQVQLEMIKAAGFDCGQGYLLGRPQRYVEQNRQAGAA